MMRILVTGAAGFIGSHLCDALLDAGHRVVGLDCFTDYYDRALKEANLVGAMGRPGFTLVEADLLEVNLVGLLREVDGVYHLAGQPGVRCSWGRNFELYVRNNVLATQRLLEAALQVGGRPVVYASSSSVYGNQPTMPLHEEMAPAPISPYGVTKLAAEHLCRLYSAIYRLPMVSLRLFTVYGPRQRPDMAFQRFFLAARDGGAVHVYGDGAQTRDFTYVGDVVRAFQLAMVFCRSGGALDGDGRIFNVAGGSRVRLRDTLALMARVTGQPLHVCHEVAQPGDVQDTWAETRRAQQDLGFTAQVGLEEGLVRQWQHILANGASFA
jgi:nucleoside-diphosphate-sugar epimerase